MLLVMRVVRHPAVRPKIDLHRGPGTLDRAVQVAKLDVDQPCAGRQKASPRDMGGVAALLDCIGR